MCESSRNAENHVPAFKQQMDKLPWKAVALPKIKNMQMSKEIQAGFKNVKEFEQETDEVARRAIQLKHLLNVAHHEQGVILQPLIYDDEDFSKWLEVQRSIWLNWASPALELVFNSSCSTNTASMKSVAPKDINLETFHSRIDWIKDAAKDFHNLMQIKLSYMERELQIIATWFDMEDH